MHPRINFFSFWELMGVFEHFLILMFSMSSHQVHTKLSIICAHIKFQMREHPRPLMHFLACSQTPNVLPKMFTIAHHTLSHNFCQS
jgi:hypothetical protein